MPDLLTEVDAVRIVDARRTHSMRIANPDRHDFIVLSIAGVPNRLEIEYRPTSFPGASASITPRSI